MTDEQIAVLAERFCATPLPESVCADLIAIKPGPGRSGTNLMTVVEAKQMLTAILTPTGSAEPEIPAARLKDAVTELLSHRGERPYRILRGGQELWETWLPAFEAALRYLPKPVASQSGGDALREALEPVLHWYQSDEHAERPLLDIVRDVVADLQSDRKDALRLAALSHPTTTAADATHFEAFAAGWRVNAPDPFGPIGQYFDAWIDLRKSTGMPVGARIGDTIEALLEKYSLRRLDTYDRQNIRYALEEMALSATAADKAGDGAK